MRGSKQHLFMLVTACTLSGSVAYGAGRGGLQSETTPGFPENTGALETGTPAIVNPPGGSGSEALFGASGQRGDSQWQGRGRESPAKVIGVVRFDAASTTLPAAESAKLRSALSSMRTQGELENVRVVAWSDTSLSMAGAQEVSETDLSLAEERGGAVANYLETTLGVSDTDVVNMADPQAHERLQIRGAGGPSTVVVVAEMADATRRSEAKKPGRHKESMQHGAAGQRGAPAHERSETVSPSTPGATSPAARGRRVQTPVDTGADAAPASPAN